MGQYGRGYNAGGLETLEGATGSSASESAKVIDPDATHPSVGAMTSDEGTGAGHCQHAVRQADYGGRRREQISERQDDQRQRQEKRNSGAGRRRRK